MKDATIAMVAIGMLGAWNAACAQTRERAVEPEQVAEWLGSAEIEDVRTASQVITSAFGWDRDAYSPHERSVFIGDLAALIVNVRDDHAPSVISMGIAAATLSIIIRDSVDGVRSRSCQSSFSVPMTTRKASRREA